MIKITLAQVLEGQDFNAKKAAENALNGEPVDPITQIILEAFLRGEGSGDWETTVADLDYAIKSLDRARRNVSKLGVFGIDI